jgi:hypothetical protein
MMCLILKIEAPKKSIPPPRRAGGGMIVNSVMRVGETEDQVLIWQAEDNAELP